MANTTIHTLAYKLTMDAEKFRQGSMATKAEMTQARKIFRETRTDAEKYGATVDQLGNLLQKGAIDVDTYNRKLKQLDDKQKQLTKSSAGFGTALGGIKNQFAALLPAITVAGTVAYLKQTTDAIDETAKAARKFGVDFNNLRQIQYAASIDTSVSLEQLGKSFQRMGITIADAGMESKTAVDALSALNLEAGDLMGLSLDQQFLKIADGIAGIADENQRLATAQDVFGKAGADLIPLLEKGSTSIAALAEEHKRLVGQLSDEQTTKIENANDALTRVGASMSKIAESAAVLAAGPLEAVAKGLEVAANYMSGRGTVTSTILAASGAYPAIASDLPSRSDPVNTDMNWFQKLSLQYAYGGITGRYTGIGSREINDATFAVSEYMKQSSIRATGGGNAPIVELGPRSIEQLNQGELQAERRTRVN